jgi:hypothetical protein
LSQASICGCAFGIDPGRAEVDSRCRAISAVPVFRHGDHDQFLTDGAGAENLNRPVHGVTNTLALLRLLPMSDRDKDAEILALRHQIMVLERQLHGDRVRFTRADRVWLAALLHPLPRTVLNPLRLLCRPETVRPAPPRRRSETMPAQDPPDRPRRDKHADVAALPHDPQVSPAGILSRQPHDPYGSPGECRCSIRARCL